MPEIAPDFIFKFCPRCKAKRNMMLWSVCLDRAYEHVTAKCVHCGREWVFVDGMLVGQVKRKRAKASKKRAKEASRRFKQLQLDSGLTVKSAMSDPLNSSSPKTGTIATFNHSPRSVAASSASPRRLWQSTFQRLWNRETGKNRGNTMLKAGEGGSTPLFQGVEGKGHEESTKLRFGRPNEIEARFRFLFKGFCRRGVRV